MLNVEDPQIFFNAFTGEVRKIFNEDKDKYLVLSWIIFNANYSEEYKELKRNQCYFSFSMLEISCNIKRKKLQRIIKELENEGFIEWIFRSNSKGKESILGLKKGYGSGYGSRYGSNGINTSVEVSKDTVKDTVEDTLSKKQYKKQSNNNIYSPKIETIFNYWNSKNIIKHRSLTPVIKKAIEKALKSYEEREIIECINIYSEILNSEFKFSYKWSLSDFLNRGNGIRTFTEEGTNRVNYEEWRKKGEINNGNTKRYISRNRGRFTEGTTNFKYKEESTNIRSFTDEEIRQAGLK